MRLLRAPLMMHRLRWRLDAFFERHPRLRRVDRVLGTVLFLMFAASVAGVLAEALGGPVALQVAVAISLFACCVWGLACEVRS